MYVSIIKPIFDWITAVLLILLLSPVWLCIIVFLAIANRGKVFFLQDRPGKNGKIFKLYKFKTMNDLKDEKGMLLDDENRLTWAGKLVRKTSLDEVPQMINIIKGEMSFIGPRPWLVEYLTLYTSEQRKRHQLKPGITGWAQVNGRNLVSWDKRFEYDLYYVKHISFWLDIKIIILTVLNVITSRGISGEGTQTMDKFKGSRENVTIRNR